MSVAFCQGFLEKVFAYIFIRKTFSENPEGLTLTEFSCWIRERIIFGFCFYFLCPELIYY